MHHLKEEYPELKSIIDKEFSKFNNLNFYVRRGLKYVQNGCNENEEQALEVDRKIENLLETIPHTVIDHNTDVDVLIDQICDDILKHKKENS